MFSYHEHSWLAETSRKAYYKEFKKVRLVFVHKPFDVNVVFLYEEPVENP